MLTGRTWWRTFKESPDDLTAYLEIFLQTASIANTLFICSDDNIHGHMVTVLLDSHLGLSSLLSGIIKSWVLCTKFSFSSFIAGFLRFELLDLNSRWALTTLH